MSVATQMVAMRDGVRLATDVYLPDGAGPFPVIMERTPYGRHETSRANSPPPNRTPASRAELAAYFTAHGYAVVYPGHPRPLRLRRPLRQIPVRWRGRLRYLRLAARPAVVRRAHLHHGPVLCRAHAGGAGLPRSAGLVAQVLDCGGFANSWKSGIRQSGAFELKQATWAFKNALVSPEAVADPVLRAALDAEDIRDWFTRMPWKPGHSPLRHHPDYEAYLFDQWTHGADDDFWQQLGIWTEGWHDRYSRAACVHMSSWWDPYPLTATSNYTGLKRAGRGPQRLILGPWTHGDRSDHCFGDVEFGPDAPLDSWAGDWRAYRLRFFDHVVKGAALDEPAVRVFVMGGGSGRRDAAGHLEHGGRWISASDWPPPGVDFVPFHLHGDGRLDRAAPASGAAPLSLRFRSRASGADDRRGDEQPGTGGCGGQLGPGGGAGVLRVLAAVSAAGVAARRAGVPDRAVARAGAGRGADRGRTVGLHRRAGHRFHRQADRRASGLAPTIPGGYAMNLTDGILRLRYAEDPAAPRLRRPGEVVRVRITLFPTANLFLPGHRIRLDVSSSNFPKFDVNPNTGEPEGLARRRRIAVNTVFVDADRPSKVVLPLLSV